MRRPFVEPTVPTVNVVGEEKIKRPRRHLGETLRTMCCVRLAKLAETAALMLRCLSEWLYEYENAKEKS